MNERQRRFVRAYAQDPDGYKAAARAGYSPTAKSYASTLLRKPAIAAEIAAREAARAERRRVTADRVLEEFARIAFADIRDYATWGPDGVSLRAADEIADGDSAAIVEVSVSSRGKTPRLKLHDKKAALNALARHLGLFDAPPPSAGATTPGDETARLRAKLMERIAALAAAPEKPGNGEDQ